MRLAATRREGERVMPLELFFDLVFVLAFTQCTGLMVDELSWEGIGQGALVLLLLWWAWAAYAWLTSVIDPEEGGVRIVILVAMGALLVAALSVPQAFGDRALAFAIAYGVVRAAHIGLFVLASPEDPGLRRATAGISVSTGVCVALLVAGALAGGTAQVVLWIVAAALDLGEPYLADASGWRLEPAHFAERHGLIVIVALGESIVALGVGAEAGLAANVVLAAALGIVLVFELWWTYFDIVSIANVRRLVRAEAGQDQNALARDTYSYLHFPLVLGIILAAFGLHEVLLHPDYQLELVAAFGLCGGVALYLLGHVALRWRGAGTLNAQRLALACLLLALLPGWTELAGVLTLAIVTALLAVMIAYETRGYGGRRQDVRHAFAVEGPLAEIETEPRRR